jgi:hypothetical protein
MTAIAAVGAAIIAGSAGAAAGSSSQAGNSATAALMQKVLSHPPKPTPALLAAGALVRVDPATGKLQANATSPARCHFAPSRRSKATPGTIDDAHESKSVGGAVKVNSYIVCDHPVQALSNQTSLYKTGHFLIFPVSHLQAQTTTNNAGKAVLPNLRTYRHCTNTKSTTWYGTAYGVSEEGGQFYIGYGQSPHKRTYRCGT